MEQGTNLNFSRIPTRRGQVQPGPIVQANGVQVSDHETRIADLEAKPFGFVAGDGGTVTQLTSKSTAVTLNKMTGTIVMNNAALAAASVVSFTFNNSLLAAEDMIVVSHHATGTFGQYHLNACVTGAGAASIAIKNDDVTSLSEAIVLKFAVIKSVVA